ncbi:hypothetical protein BOTBODRAFT_121951, partial [Botryobasidium botryosum FD-172 SS1]
HGREEPAKLASAFITNLFACPKFPPPSSANFLSLTLAQFIAYSLHCTRLHSGITFATPFPLNRLKGHFPTACDSSHHRLFISAFMIASEIICDDTHSNKLWRVIEQGDVCLLGASLNYPKAGA